MASSNHLFAGTNHFSPVTWVITVSEFSLAQLESEPVAQSVFLHEYIHYVQSLVGTVGRQMLTEMARLSIYAGLQKLHGGLPSGNWPQMDLEATLLAAVEGDFSGTDVSAQFVDVMSELAFCLAAEVVDIGRSTGAPSSCVRAPLSVHGHTVSDFVHIELDWAGRRVVVPLTDRAVYENMARQIQRNFLLFSNSLDTTRVDSLLASKGEVTYRCIDRHLATLLHPGESAARWTIGLCQMALQCRNPGSALEHMFSRLQQEEFVDLQAFEAVLGKDAWFDGEYNEPAVQPILNELVGKWGSAVKATERWELREFTKSIASATNSVQGRPGFFAEPLLEWAEVLRWVKLFGCPPVVCKDGVAVAIGGVAVGGQPWTNILQRTSDLLYQP